MAAMIAEKDWQHLGATRKGTSLPLGSGQNSRK
ncbi:predicted protein [Sclerotinia sclerotiorum 1980 UF-70]|uniref:Uncharacterized protein n=1 Tax=Sclerotinia sclerotiorum (strain ATCC 18683 / 1980 / Ss-1) TaxID=665079 RepID=A7EYV1_SCLS1|nr:predicted protein [Sclerotinia sclerotiorum 1980 UF-70]EDN94643.1 predicted protein [Sclerotinia sclerotiorum 1980 UF-70]